MYKVQSLSQQMFSLIFIQTDIACKNSSHLVKTTTENLANE